MALAVDYPLHGVTIPGTYVRLSTVTVHDKDRTGIVRVRARFDVWPSQADHQSDMPANTIDSIALVFEADPDQPLHSQAYAALKARAEFADAVDV